MIRANSLLFAIFSTLSWNTSRKTAPMFWRNPLHLSKFSSFQITFGMNGYFFQSSCIELNLIRILMHINHSSKATAVMCLTTTWPAWKIRSKWFNRTRMQLAKQLWLSAYFYQTSWNFVTETKNLQMWYSWTHTRRCRNTFTHILQQVLENKEIISTSPYRNNMQLPWHFNPIKCWVELQI